MEALDGLDEDSASDLDISFDSDADDLLALGKDSKRITWG
jgi:hypothetical protein